MKKLALYFALAIFCQAAAAGVVVRGVGETPEQAMSVTADLVIRGAQGAGTCISRMPDLATCKHFPAMNRYQCEAVYANHEGSCPKKSERAQLISAATEIVKAYASSVSPNPAPQAANPAKGPQANTH